MYALVMDVDLVIYLLLDNQDVKFVVYSVPLA